MEIKEEKKSNTGLKVVVVIMTVISICLGVLTIYLFNNKSVKCEDCKISETDNKDDNVDQEVVVVTYNEKEYKLSLENKEIEEETVDGDILYDYKSYLNIDDKKIELPIDGSEIGSFDFESNLIYINGNGDSSYTSACIVDLEAAKVVKTIDGGFITGSNILIGDQWNNYQVYSVCTGGSEGSYSIRGFSLEDVNDDILLFTGIAAHCSQED